MHEICDLIAIFNECFKSSYNTVLVCGEDEPLYLPAERQGSYHTIFFAHGYFSSALHECAHWLIAGEERRKQIDYGYWYIPDGRTTEQQLQFQQVEVKPQALEWILSKAANFPFQFSIDNLNGEETDTQSFKEAVSEQVLLYEKQGLSPRAEIFRAALSRFYQIKSRNSCGYS
jgi:elongation factor P hydroxylase